MPMKRKLVSFLMRKWTLMNDEFWETQNVEKWYLMGKDLLLSKIFSLSATPAHSAPRGLRYGQILSFSHCHESTTSNWIFLPTNKKSNWTVLERSNFARNWWMIHLDATYIWIPICGTLWKSFLKLSRVWVEFVSSVMFSICILSCFNFPISCKPQNLSAISPPLPYISSSSPPLHLLCYCTTKTKLSSSLEGRKGVSNSTQLSRASPTQPYTGGIRVYIEFLNIVMKFSCHCNFFSS